jgi:uroporphyrinogen-III synthase
MSRAVILFKSPPRVPTADTYVQQLEAAGYTPYFIEVLESTFSNEQMLEGIVRTGPTCGVGFAGVVITSNRAADAWIQALSRITEPGRWLVYIKRRKAEVFFRGLVPNTFLCCWGID